jgi:hypothetical protein
MCHRRDAYAVTTMLAREAAAYGVPQSVLGRMVTTSPRDMAWLSPSELRAMRVSIIDSNGRLLSRSGRSRQTGGGDKGQDWERPSRPSAQFGRGWEPDYGYGDQQSDLQRAAYEIDIVLRQEFGNDQIPTDRGTLIAIARAVGTDPRAAPGMALIGTRVRLHNMSNGTLTPGSRIDASCAMMRPLGVDVC